MVRPGYSSVGYILGENRKKQLTFEMGEGGEEGINKNVTDTKRDRRGVTTDLGGGQGRNKQKRYRHKT